MSEDTVVVSGNATAGEGSVQVSLHPLPLLNISEHYTRSRIRSGGDPNVKGEQLAFLDGTIAR